MSVSFAYKFDVPNHTVWYCSCGEINTVLYQLIHESYNYYEIGEYIDKKSIDILNIKDFYLYIDFIHRRYSVHKILGVYYDKCPIIDILNQVKLCM